MSEVLDQVKLQYLNTYAGIYHTKRAKRNDLELFFNFIKTSGIDLVSDINRNIIQLFIESLIREGFSPSTISRRLSTIKHFFRWLQQEGVVNRNPADSVRFSFNSKNRPDHLTSSEIKELQEKIENRLSCARGFREYQDYFFVLFLLETGVRANEARVLRLSQITSDLNWIRNLRSKGNKFRDVYISTKLRKYLKEFIQIRDQFLKKKLRRGVHSQNYPLFLSFYGKEHKPERCMLSPKTIWRITKRVGGEFDLHPHKLRHTFAIRLLNHTKDIRLVSQALGHSDVRITMKYTERTQDEIKDALDTMI